ATQILAIEDADPLTEPEDAFAMPGAAAGDPFDAADPFATTIPPIEPTSRAPAFDRFEHDPFERAPLEAEPLRADDLDMDAPFGAEPELAAEPVESEPWEDVAPHDAPAAIDVAPSASLARAELRDMLEKIAWDAFAPITEKIVREAIAR